MIRRFFDGIRLFLSELVNSANYKFGKIKCKGMVLPASAATAATAAAGEAATAGETAAAETAGAGVGRNNNVRCDTVHTAR